MRREVAVSLKGASFPRAKRPGALIDGYDGRSRYYLEALGVAFHGKEKCTTIDPSPFSQAPAMAMESKESGRRLHAPDPYMTWTCAFGLGVSVDEFRFLAMAF